jgi:phage recombination protein Bet
MREFSERERKFIGEVICKNLMEAELEAFLLVAERAGLDPIARQIYPQLYISKDGERTVSHIVTIDGYRTVADRTGNYRPGTRRVYCYDELKSPTNPHGISHAEVSVWKYIHGAWHEFADTAYWDEYAPLRRDNRGGDYLPRTSAYYRQGRNMLMKCAEAAVLRRGWPDEMGGLYTDTEMERATASAEGASAAHPTSPEPPGRDGPPPLPENDERAERQARLPKGIPLQFYPDKPQALYPVDDVVGEIENWLAEISEHSENPAAVVAEFESRNRYGLLMYWVEHPANAQIIKRMMAEVANGLHNQATEGGDQAPEASEESGSYPTQ